MRVFAGAASGRAARPLACYYAIALAVPVLNGATIDAAFLEHAAFVLAVPLAAVTGAAGIRRLLRRPGRPANGGCRTQLPVVSTTRKRAFPLIIRS
jgi:hypothetical protein